MASLLGIDGLAEKVQTIITGVRTCIDQAIDGMIDKAKDWFKGNGKKGRNPEEEGEQQNDPANDEVRLEDEEIGEVVPFEVDGESHKIWIEENGNNVEVMMASDPVPIEEKIVQWDKKITDYEIKDEKDKTEEDIDTYTKARSMYNLVVKCYGNTKESSVNAAKIAAELETDEEKERSIKRTDRNLKDKKITSEESDRQKNVIKREHEENLKTRFEEVDYHVEQSEIALKEAIKRLLLLLDDTDKVSVGDEEIGLTDEDKTRVSEYYDIAVIGVGSAAARWLYTNTKSYEKGIIIGETGGWKDRGQETTSHPKSIVSPRTPTEEEQSKGSLMNEKGETIFERADDHISDIESLVKKSGFARLEESCKSIHKEGEWSLISYGNNKHTIAARKIVLATGAGPESEVARDVENGKDSKLYYKKVVTLNEFLNEVEGLNPEDLTERQKKFGKREVLIFGGNAAVDAIDAAEKLGFIVHPLSRSGFVGHLEGTKNTTSKELYEEKIKDKEAQKEFIAGYYERHELSNGRVKVYFTGGKEIEVDQFVTAIGPDSRQIATKDKEAGPIAILGGPSGVKKLLQPIYDLGKSYSDEVFGTVLGLESEDGLLEVIGAAAFRVGQFVDDTEEAIKRFNELKEEEKQLTQLSLSSNKDRLEELENMLDNFLSVRNKFDNTRKAHSRSVIVAEQLGSLNSTIEAINRVNAIIKDNTGKTKQLVEKQITDDGINMQIDNWPSIQQYIIINWNRFSAETNLSDIQKQDLAKKAAKAIVSSRRKSDHPHGITWKEAEEIIKKFI